MIKAPFNLPTSLSCIQPGRLSRLQNDIQQRRKCLKRFERTMEHVTLVFEQVAVTLLECQEILTKLLVLRRQVKDAALFLRALPSDLTEIVCPGGCITRFDSLFLLLSETLQGTEVLREISTHVCYERIPVQMHLLILMPELQDAYQDSLSQMAALCERAQIAHELLTGSPELQAQEVMHGA